MRTAIAFLTLAVTAACDPETAPLPEAETRPVPMPGMLPGLDRELPRATAGDEDPRPKCRFRADWPNVGWVHFMWTQPSPRNLAVTLPVPCTLRQSTVVLRGRKKTKTTPMFSGQTARTWEPRAQPLGSNWSPHIPPLIRG